MGFSVQVLNTQIFQDTAPLSCLTGKESILPRREAAGKVAVYLRRQSRKNWTLVCQYDHFDAPDLGVLTNSSLTVTKFGSPMRPSSPSIPRNFAACSNTAEMVLGPINVRKCQAKARKSFQ